ncbi:MAG TPA: hypothetical protein VN922_23910 [Bacteroidia bacterium]|nr:hypothetical protein [Bacteroidia bacterium]
MKALFKVLFLGFSVTLLLGFVAFIKPLNNTHKAVQQVASFSPCSTNHEFSTQNIPGTPVVQIRHRSPREVDEIIVPAPNEKVVYISDLAQITPEYFSKWNTYFHFDLETLPDDQASPTVHSLRAPPFNC